MIIKAEPFIKTFGVVHLPSHQRSSGDPLDSRMYGAERVIVPGFSQRRGKYRDGACFSRPSSLSEV